MKIQIKVKTKRRPRRKNTRRTVTKTAKLFDVRDVARFQLWLVERSLQNERTIDPDYDDDGDYVDYD
jgi:hypothetical protein